MTSNIDSDAIRQKQGNQPMLPFSGGDLDRSGIRLTRAEFARFLEVSKQSVTDWVKSGKVTLGADGRLDPRQAVSQLLRSTDPARLRSKVLAPLVKDVGMYQKRISDLEQQLRVSNDDKEFYEACMDEFSDKYDALGTRIQEEWRVLRILDPDIALAAIAAWIEDTDMNLPSGVEISSFIVLADESESSTPGALLSDERGEV